MPLVLTGIDVFEATAIVNVWGLYLDDVAPQQFSRYPGALEPFVKVTAVTCTERKRIRLRLFQGFAPPGSDCTGCVNKMDSRLQPAKP